ncbi:MAG: class I SAM-dependent methyltransferase [Crocinitomicaceae bacterium]|nr:class I SAM-dependent methyltransferase [Crocinitomicaceae bacterium]
MNKLLELIFNPGKILRYGFARFDEDRHQKMCAEKYNKKQLPTVNLAELAASRSETIEPFSFLDGTSMITDIFLLKTLARKFSNCNYLEIGSWRGESIANVSSVAEKCTSVTLSPEEMRTMNFGEKFISCHGVFSEGIKNISTYHANSHSFDFKSLNEKYDVIFIDGDHSFAGVLNDTRKVFDLRKDKKSFIVWHDYGYSAETVRYSVLNAILQGIPEDKHKHLFHVSNTMCAIYCEDLNLNVQYVDFPTMPDKKFKIELSFSEFRK